MFHTYRIAQGIQNLVNPRWRQRAVAPERHAGRHAGRYEGVTSVCSSGAQATSLQL